MIDGYPVQKHPNYAVWSSMKQRCKSTPLYTNKGVTYDPDWEHFANFCRDMGVRPTPEHTLDRIDNDGGYHKGNCRWATRTQQCLNRGMFSNNTSGFTGVKEKGGRYTATYHEGRIRYRLGGSFATPKEAAAARLVLIAKLQSGLDVSDMLERPPRFDSSTGIRGITRHKNGGYMVRVTSSGQRLYLGHFKTLDAAKERLEQWVNENK